ncbi:hypothetical protein DFH09DRAFT_946861 [Mycena vulgaris]|nr:hypothetical protein DFH09DRAFT_946861 [Mycena vulgaris]
MADQHSFDDFTNEPLFAFDDSPYLTSPLETFEGDDFGTSPMDTPYSTFLPTPLSTPLMIDGDLFSTSPHLDGDLFGAVFDEPAPAPAPKMPSTAQLWTIPSTPTIEPTSTVFPSTSRSPVIPPAPQHRRGVTGTRKNLTPDALIPLDAPTQKRTYATPSATSRKAVPAAIAKKRAHSVAFPDVDEEELAALPATASEAELIEWKRRQNTIAARKSRKRKLEHQQMLEDEVAGLRSEVAVWRERAMMAQEMLRGQGIMFSFDS